LTLHWNRAVLWTRLLPTIMKSHKAVHNDCTAKLAALEGMTAPALRTLWREVIGRPVASELRRELLIPILAYKLQEKAYGGLKPNTRTQLRRLAALLAADKSAPLTRESRFKPGTRLIREWRGETHEVTIHASGYEYRGREFATLSEIANLISGTRWSGPLFFGTKSSSKKSRQ
jgi:hypothetical protein